MTQTQCRAKLEQQVQELIVNQDNFTNSLSMIMDQISLISDIIKESKDNKGKKKNNNDDDDDDDDEDDEPTPG